MQYKPENYSTVSPYLVVNGAGATIEFLVKVFNAVELRRFPDASGKLLHAEVRIDDTVIMLGDAAEGWPPTPAHVHIYVRDVDVTYQQAIEAGATSIQEPVQKEDNTSQVILESSRKAAPEAVEEYARIHQISNLKTSEFYLTHPDYAREHPYTPTSEDIAHYEREFLEKTYPKFKELAEKKGFMEARHIYMSNPADGPGNLHIGSRKYTTAMRQLALGDGDGASTGRTNPMLEDDSAAEHYQEGTRLYRQDRLDDATEHMEEALKAKPDSPTLLATVRRPAK